MNSIQKNHAYTNDPWLILVDPQDHTIGHAPKHIAHEYGMLHRAFSVMLLDKQNPHNVLLQQRHTNKYHGGELWSNACCSHPYPNEPLMHATERRLNEELGMQTQLTHIGQFTYSASFSSTMHEHEIDHVFVGLIDSHITCHYHPEEIMALRWATLEELSQALKQDPTSYTPWLAQVVDITYQWLQHKHPG